MDHLLEDGGMYFRRHSVVFLKKGQLRDLEHIPAGPSIPMTTNAILRFMSGLAITRILFPYKKVLAGQKIRLASSLVNTYEIIFLLSRVQKHILMEESNFSQNDSCLPNCVTENR